MKSTLQISLLLLAWAALGQGRVAAQTCTLQSTLNYAAFGTANGSRKAATNTAGNTTITTSGYTSTVSGGNANTYSVDTDTGIMPTKALLWNQNTQGATGAIVGQPTSAAAVTYTFSRPVTNLTISIADIDQDLVAGKFTDLVTFDGYVNAADATPIALVAGDVVLGSQNEFVAGSNAVRGKGPNPATTADNAVITFPQPITKLVLSYQNVYPYAVGDNRNQAVGINYISFCSQADVYTQFTAGPVTATASQNVAYTVRFGNSGPDITATSVVGSVTLPAGVTGIGTGGGTLSGNTITYNVGSLASGATASYTYTYTLPAATAGTYNNTAAVTAATSATGYDPPANNAATRSVLVSTGAGACTTAPVDLDLRTRPTGEVWSTKTNEGVPALTSRTKIVSTAYSSLQSASTLAIGTLNGKTLRWDVDYTGNNNGDPNSSTVTYTFSRPVSNFSVRVQDIDGNESGPAGSLLRNGYVDQVQFSGSDGTTTFIPNVNKVVAASTTVSVNVAAGTATGNTVAASSADNGAVVATFLNPITSLTLTYRNVIAGDAFLAPTVYNGQAVGIDLMSWCRLMPVANDITSATLPSSAGQVSISGFSSSVDGTVQTYTLVSVPTAAQGVLYYNSNGSTYLPATAGQTLTEAQAATLRFDPAAGASGGVTFGYTVQDDASLSSNTATYTIPVNNTTCTVNTTTLAYAARPGAESWKAHAALSVPAGSPLTTISSGPYVTPGSATTSTFATADFNGVQTLQWFTDYANQTDKSSSVTFTFSRAVSNFAVRVQDIDAAQDNANAFIDRVTFSGANGATAVTPALSMVNPDNGAVIIAGTTAIGTVNNTSPDDATVMAYFPSPITTLTLTYANGSVYDSNPTQQAIGIDLMTWCQLAPTAAAITSASLPATAPATAITTLSGTADGVLQTYTLSTLPTPAMGVLYVNGVAATPGQSLNLTEIGQLSFDPNPTYVGTASFTYTATDGQGNISAPANYTLLVTAVADVTTALSGPATLNPGLPSGTYTATFTNNGPSTASTVTKRVTLPAGATNVFRNGVAYVPTGNVIDFGTATTLASGTTDAFTFSFTAPAGATGTLAVTSNVTGSITQGANLGADASTITATVAPVADVAVTITAAPTSVAAGTLATATTPPKFTVNFTNGGPVTAAGVAASVQLPAGLTNVVATNGGTYNSTTGVVTYAGLTSLAVGTTASVITFDAPANGPVMAVADISTTTSEAAQMANDKASASLGITPAFDLATTLSGPASVTQGNLVTLALTTTNNGPSAAANVLSTITISSGLSNVYVSNGGSYASGTGVVTFPAISSLPSGQVVTNSVSFSAPSTAFAPSALVTPNTAAGGETLVANNTAYLNAALTSTNLTINPVTANKSNIYTAISSSVASTTAGSPVTLTVISGNNGPTAAPSLVQTVRLMPGFTTATIQVGGQTGTLSGTTINFASGAAYNTLTGVVTFPTIASQASGSSVSNTITFTAPANAGNNGQLLAVAAVRTTNSDPVPADNVASTTVALTPATDLASTLTGPTSVVAGQPVQYTAMFVNNGGSAAGGYNSSGQTSGVFETAQLPIGLSGVTITDGTGAAVTGAYNATTGLVTFPTLATDPVGAVQVFNLSFIAPASNFVVSSGVSTATTDGTGGNNSASIATTVAPAADLTTTATGPATAVAGNAATYSMTTTNNGPSPASNVAPTLQLAAGLTTVSVSDGSYNSGSGLVTFNTVASLASGASMTNSVTFVMPSPASGQTSGVASTTSATRDLNTGNNTVSVATSVAPATEGIADVVATASASAASAAAGAPLTFTATFSNNGPGAATNVAPTLQLPAGLTVGTISNSGSYNVATGLVTWPVIASQASGAGGNVSYTVALTAPATGPVVATASSTANTSEPASAAAQANDVFSTSVAITATFDEVTTLSGPASALPGTSQTYTATATNNGPSATANATTQTVTLPAGVTATNISNGGTQSGTTITWTIPAGQVPGSTGAVANTFTIVQPAGGATLNSTATVTGESNFANNQATPLTTTVPNQPPLAYAIMNILQSPQGNTAAQLPITALSASDPEGALSSTTPFTLVTVPLAAHGVVYYHNGTTYVAAAAGQTLTSTQATSLRFQPGAGYAGNAAFTYHATDNAGNQSPAVTYAIAVAPDINSAYTVYNAGKGTSNPYVTGDALAQIVDPNTAVYNGTGVIYSTTGVLQGGASNGLALTGANAVLASGTLPTGVSLDPATGRIYVSNAALLPRVTTATSYTVGVTTTDLNGGTNTAPVTFTLGAYPLPVELTDFTATAKNVDAALVWHTASEKNNDHFDVERSLTGLDFVKIGQVAGQGSSTAPTAYALTDAGIGKTTALAYYRLKQVDRDGTSTYSPVRTVSFTKSVAPAISLWPNPASTATQLDLSQLPTGTYQVSVLDATGRVVLSATHAAGLSYGLELNSIASGTYVVLVRGQNNGQLINLTKRLIKE